MWFSWEEIKKVVVVLFNKVGVVALARAVTVTMPTRTVDWSESPLPKAASTPTHLKHDSTADAAVASPFSPQCTDIILYV